MICRALATILLSAALLSGCSGDTEAASPLAGRSEEATFELRQLAVDPHGGGDATLSPDGEKFVISSRRAGYWDLWQFDLRTESWTQLTDHPGDDFEARWSPDGRRMAFTSTRGDGKHIWLLHTDDGRLEQLTFGEHEEEYADWSPDGTTISYTAGPWLGRDIFLLPASGGEPRRVTKKSGMAGACSFDPAGDSLVCHRYDLGAGNLERMWLDGETAPLTQGPAWDYKPAVSPDGKWIAFSRSIEGPSRIWLMPSQGGRPVQLTNSSSDDRWPTWGKGGSRLFFHRLVNEGKSLRWLDLESGEVRELVDAEQKPQQASFDPSGERVVFCAEGASGKRLRLVELEGGGIQDLETGEGEACFPRWSPDGRSIAYAFKADPASRWELAVVAPDGSGRRVLTAGFETLRGLDGPMDWSPDSRRLVFHSDTDPYEANLFVLSVESGELERLTEDHWFDEAPSFTADGRGVLFMSTRGGGWTWGLFRFDLASGEITGFAGPDYTEKNFVRPGTAGSLLWTQVDASGERVVRRTEAGDLEEIEGTQGGRWPSLSRDGRRLLFTEMSHRVEYWLIENPAGSGSPVRAEAPSRALAAAGSPVAPAVDGECGSAVRQPTARLARFEGFRRQGTECREPVAAVSATAGAATRPSTSPVDLHHR